MKISVAQLIVQFLKEARVPYIFGLSGHSIFPITDALYTEPNIQFIPVMHELSAAYMAAAYAKGKTGTPQTHHCTVNGAEVSKTKKECKKAGGMWEKGAPTAAAPAK